MLNEWEAKNILTRFISKDIFTIPTMDMV